MYSLFAITPSFLLKHDMIIGLCFLSYQLLLKSINLLELIFEFEGDFLLQSVALDMPIIIVNMIDI